ncbi:hypothetical protein MMC17_009693 [Xylographa soralifera]|nr:hypothetical protein [Xylographa soralifera]
MPIQCLSLFVRDSSLDNETLNLIPGLPSKPPMKGDKINFLRTGDYLPSIELMPLVTSAMDDLEEHKRHFSKIGVFSFLATLLRPKSRGTVRLGSSSPHDRPKVDFGFMAHAEDWVTARKAIRLAFKLGSAMKAQGFPLMRVLTAASPESDDEIDRLIRHRARTTYHYSNTCRMAPEFDSQAPGVVDECLRVHGIPNLRVCDASVFPQIIATHLMAPVVMVAEKCADMIKATREKEA